MIEKKKERIRESNIYVKTPFLKYSAITINLESILGNLNLYNWQFIWEIYWFFICIILTYFGPIVFIFIINYIFVTKHYYSRSFIFLLIFIWQIYIYIFFIFYLELYKNNNPTAAFIYYLYILNGSLFKSNIFNESIYLQVLQT